MGCEGSARETLVALTNDPFRICGPSRGRDETAVHVERRARAWAAVRGGWSDLDPCVVELEGVACEELGYPLRDQLIAMPFGLAEVFLAVAPVLPEATGAFEAGDLAEHRGKPRDKCVDRPGPVLGLASVICVGVFATVMGAIIRPQIAPPILRHCFPQIPGGSD